jgi:hypothetical protein
MTTAAPAKATLKKAPKSTHHTKSADYSAPPTKAEIADADRKSAASTEVDVKEKVATFATKMDWLKPKDAAETELRKNLFVAAETYFRSDELYKAAGRRLLRARRELGAVLEGYKTHYKTEWNPVCTKLAEALGVSEKTVERYIELYLLKRKISTWENAVAERLEINVDKALVRELVDVRLKDGVCQSEKEAYRRVKLADERVKAKGKSEQDVDPSRAACLKALVKYLKKLDPEERKEQLKELSSEVESTLSEALEEDESQDEWAA